MEQRSWVSILCGVYVGSWTVWLSSLIMGAGFDLPRAIGGGFVVALLFAVLSEDTLVYSIASPLGGWVAINPLLIDGVVGTGRTIVSNAFLDSAGSEHTMLLLMIVFGLGYGGWFMCVISVSRELKDSREFQHEWRATPRRVSDPLRFVIGGMLAILIPVGIEVVSWLVWSDRLLPHDVVGLSIFLGLVIVGIGILSGAASPVRYRAYDVGLAIDYWAETFVPWSQYNGYRVNDECIVLDCRWTFDRRLNRESIDDVDACIEGLDEHLDRLA